MKNLTFFNPKFDLLQPVRQWLESIEIDHPKQAHFLCKIIPAHCPFERKIVRIQVIPKSL